MVVESRPEVYPYNVINHLVEMEKTTKEKMLDYLKSVDEDAVRLARYRTSCLGFVARIDDQVGKEHFWQEIDKADEEMAENFVYRTAISICEQLTPPVDEQNDKESRLVSKLGSSYEKDHKSGIRKLISRR